MKIKNNCLVKMNLSHLSYKILQITKEGKCFIIILMRHFLMCTQLIKINCLDLTISTKIKM